MKLPANVLAICLTGVVAAGCETAADFERRAAPVPPSDRTEVQTVEVDLGRIAPSYAKPPPGAAPRATPTPAPVPTITKVRPTPAPAPKAKAIECGPCGMG